MTDLADVLKIPGNKPVYSHLWALLQERTATAFVGAGASAGLYPLWSDLIAGLAHLPVERGFANEADEKRWLAIAVRQPQQAVQQIRSAAKDEYYLRFLAETFQDRVPTHTEIHAALMRMNFKAWLTTNYDSGLIAAGDVNRFTVWRNDWEMTRWMSGDIFKEDRPLVLFAHGHHTDPTTIVLDRNSYREAYKAGSPYRRFFENLWLQHHMVFVGFSFNDIVLGQIADEVFGEVFRQGPQAVRHIAILPLEDDYTPEMRKQFMEPYCAEVLFYPNLSRDHAALLRLLQSCSKQTVAAAAPSITVPPERRPAASPLPIAPVVPPFITVPPERQLFGAVHVGGTKCECAVGTGPDDLEMMQFPTTTPEQMFERSISFFGRCAGLQAVGIASFGPVDVRTGRIMSTPKVGWANIEITRVFRSALNVPVGFGADSDAAAMAEMKWGAAQELPTGLVVLVGTGITGSVILDGRVVHGAAPSEIGHIRVPHDLTRDPFPGVCPYHGDCLEGLASGPAVEARWGVFPATLPPNHPAWALEAHYLALAVHNWICELSPQRIVFGGGLMQQAALWDTAGDEGIMGQRRPFGLIREEVGRLLNGYTRNCDLVTSAVKYKGAVLLGALLLAKSALVAEYH